MSVYHRIKDIKYSTAHIISRVNTGLTSQNLIMVKPTGCNFYDFLHLDNHELSLNLNKLRAKSYKF